MDWVGLLSAGLQGWGAIQQGKIAKKLYNLQLKEYNDEQERKKRSQGRLNLAADRAFAHKYDSAALPLN
jgi:hypothetical protein